MSKGCFERTKPHARNSFDPEEAEFMLYAYYKQATEGDALAPGRKQPEILNFIDQAKWEAWKSLDGTSRQEAYETYCQSLNEILEKTSESPDEARFFDYFQYSRTCMAWKRAPLEEAEDADCVPA
ncbi:acyl-CoA-binding protein [Flagelloscypha sp. PMI_526]|nr:acyl-CoA-binding protein [Flagelloscypha sp. PMI_526]